MNKDNENSGASSSESTSMLLPRRVRRWPRIVLGLLIVLVFAAGGIIWQALPEDKIEVLATTRVINRGQIISEGDLRTVELEKDQSIAYINASNINTVIGQQALNYIASGTIVTPEIFTFSTPLDSTEAIIGIALDAGQYPLQPLLRGDLVDVIIFEATGVAGSASSSRIIANSAEVFSVAEIGGQTRLLVSLRVLKALTPSIAAAASQSRIWLTLVSQ